MGVLCTISPTASNSNASIASMTGNFTDFMLDSTGSYTGTITVTIQAPAFPNGSYGCAIGEDLGGNGNLMMPPWIPQAFITGVQGRLPS
jgi:hypothetical protein